MNVNVKELKLIYRIAGMFGGDKVWQIASSKVVGEKKFGKYLQQRCLDWRVKRFGWLKFGERLVIHQIRQTFPLYGTTIRIYIGVNLCKFLFLRLTYIQWV